jgi:hypothetical protein
VTSPPDIRMTLGENSLDSLQESLAKVRDTDANVTAWKFAVVHIVHAIELMLKERLQREHRLLIFQNVDKPGTPARPGATVSLETALTRLQNADVNLDDDDLRAIGKAIEWRNRITHSEFALYVREVRTVFALLFEFIHTFHLKEMDTEVMDVIAPDLKPVAAQIMEVFRQEFVVFQGHTMHRSWPSALLAAQDVRVVWLNGKPYPRFRYGEEPMWKHSEYGDFPDRPCGDCSCLPGQYHGSYCDIEQCPRCEGQFLSCDCAPDVDTDDELMVRGGLAPDPLAPALSPMLEGGGQEPDRPN